MWRSYSEKLTRSWVYIYKKKISLLFLPWTQTTRMHTPMRNSCTFSLFHISTKNFQYKADLWSFHTLPHGCYNWERIFLHTNNAKNNNNNNKDTKWTNNMRFCNVLNWILILITPIFVSLSTHHILPYDMQCILCTHHVCAGQYTLFDPLFAGTKHKKKQII